MLYYLKYKKYKKKYIDIKNQIGGFIVDQFVKTNNETIIKYLKEKNFRNIYIIKKVFDATVFIENIDSGGTAILEKYQVDILNISDDERDLLMNDQIRAKEKQIKAKEEQIKAREEQIKAREEEAIFKLNIINDQYYLATESRYRNPINILRPFGSFDEMDKLYNISNPDEVRRIKSMFVNISDVKRIGFSQYGLYFRLIKKDLVNKYLKYSNDSDEFYIGRSFLFDFKQFINYIQSQYHGVPLFWYSNFNAYGYTKYSGTTLFTNDIFNFINGLEDLEEKLYDHEFVCRIPIPLTSDTGFIGKINFGILGLNRYKNYSGQNSIISDLYNNNIVDDNSYISYLDDIIIILDKKCNKYKTRRDCALNNKKCEWYDRGQTNKQCIAKRKPFY